MARHYENSILRRLDPPGIDRLDLKPIELERGRTLEAIGQEIRSVYFLESGLASMTASFQDGSEVEVGMFGWESVIGASWLMGVRYSLNHTYMQMAGHGYIASAEAAEAEFRRCEAFHDVVLRFVQTQLVQAAQAAACNARHNLQQRLSRWLLLCRDRVQSDEMALTQDYVATMLGVERPAVSIAAARLQEMGFLQHRRGKVRILDRPGLETMACECYRVVREQLASYEAIALRLAP